jgi:hypothetical protein
LVFRADEEDGRAEFGSGREQVAEAPGGAARLLHASSASAPRCNVLSRVTLRESGVMFTTARSRAGELLDHVAGAGKADGPLGRPLGRPSYLDEIVGHLKCCVGRPPNDGSGWSSTPDQRAMSELSVRRTSWPSGKRELPPCAIRHPLTDRPKARAEWNERGRGRVPCRPSAGARRDGLRASGLSLRTLSQRGAAGRALRGRRVSCSACDRWMPVSMAARHRLNTARRGSAGVSIARSVST